MSTVVSIASGKGGVGKSTLAVNFALRLQATASNALLVDSDLLMANAHILMNYQPKLDLVHYLEGTHSLRDVVQSGPGALSILAGRTGVSVSLEQRGDPLRNLIPHIRETLEGVEYIVVDTPAGSGQDVLNSLAQSDHVVIVLLGQATSFVDAYALIKNAYLERRLAQFSVVVNAAESKRQAQIVFNNFAKTVSSFLPVMLNYCGHIAQRDAFHQASVQCKPLALMAKEQSQIAEFDTILRRILAAPRNAEHQAEVMTSGAI